MRDVFKFLKDSRKLLESKEPSEASVRAKELGYVYNYGQGTWRDPVSKRKYRFENGRFEEIQTDLPQRMDRAGAKLEKEPKTYSQFKQEVPTQDEPVGIEEPPVSNQMGRVVPGGPTETAISSGDKKEVVKQLSRGRGSVQSPARKKQVSQQADDMIAQDELETELETQDEIDVETQEPEGLDDLLSDIRDEEPLKEPSEFKTINQAVEETGQNFDGSIRNDANVDIATEESIQRVRDIANTDVEDARFDGGRQSRKEFLDHYSKDSEYRDGLNTLSKKIAVANNREKVDTMMDAINSGEYLTEIELKKGDKRTVSELLLDVGIDVNNKEQMDCFKNAHKTINSFVDRDGTWKTSENHTLTGTSLGYFESKHIAERNDLNDLTPDGIQTKSFNLRNESESSLQCVDPTITDAIHALLPKEARDFMNSSGSPKTYYDPREKSGQGKANDIRGSALLHIWTMQDGRDVYSVSGGMSSPGEFEAEHIVPLKGGGIDTIENFGNALRRTNRARSDLKLSKFVDQSKKRTKDVESDLSNPKNRERARRQLRGSKLNDVLKKKLGGDISFLFGDEVKKDLDSKLDGSLGKESESVKFTKQQYENYQNELSGYFEKSNIPKNSSIKELSPNQINGLLDIMGSNLGTDKSKLIEYWGRETINNGDMGFRTLMDSETGEMVRGRGGTEGTPKSMASLQNQILFDEKLSTEEKDVELQIANDNHQEFKKKRNNLIDNSQDPDAYEGYVGSIRKIVEHLTGKASGSKLDSERKYDTRMTYSPDNSFSNDVFSTINSLLTLSAKEEDKRTFSPASQKNGLTPKVREDLEYLKDLLVDSYSSYKNIPKEKLLNPDSLNKTQQKTILPFTTAYSRLEEGLK
jgi:hypothetical protein